MFAGVYNEYIIKRVAGDKVDIMLQNAYMYIDSIFCNLVLILGHNLIMRHPANVIDVSAEANLFDLTWLFQGFVIVIVVNNAFIGIVTSLFLKIFDSIWKAFASALELVFTAILSFWILGIPIYWNTIFAVGIVSGAVVMYAQNPLKIISTNSPKKEISNNDSKV